MRNLNECTPVTAGLYLHSAGAGCCRPSAFSLVPESSWLARFLAERAFFSFPAGLSRRRFRSCNSPQVRWLCLRSTFYEASEGSPSIMCLLRLRANQGGGAWTPT